MADDMYIANLAFLLSYDDGTSTDEIEYELFKIAFQTKFMTHYDRRMGGSFSDVEQENSNASEVIMLQFSANMVESIYLTNEEKNFDPYIISGFSDIETDLDDTTYYVTIKYRLLKDLSIQGTIEVGL